MSQEIQCELISEPKIQWTAEKTSSAEPESQKPGSSKPEEWASQETALIEPISQEPQSSKSEFNLQNEPAETGSIIESARHDEPGSQTESDGQNGSQADRDTFSLSDGETNMLMEKIYADIAKKKTL